MSFLIWILIGFSLMVLELFTGTMVIFFFGCAALLVGLATMAGITETLIPQMVLFSVLALATVYAARAKLKRLFAGDEQSEQKRGHMIGLRAWAESDFQDRRGKVMLNGSSWDAEIQDDTPIKQGDILFVHGMQGITALVSRQKPE